MNTEFLISLGITVFSAGLVFGVLKNQVYHLEKELKDERFASKNAVDRLEKNFTEKYQVVKEQIDKNDEATANVSNSIISIAQSLKYIETSINEIKNRIERLESRK
jgi:archaellum component FlaC